MLRGMKSPTLRRDSRKKNEERRKKKINPFLNGLEDGGLSVKLGQKEDQKVIKENWVVK